MGSMQNVKRRRNGPSGRVWRAYHPFPYAVRRAIAWCHPLSAQSHLERSTREMRCGWNQLVGLQNRRIVHDCSALVDELRAFAGRACAGHPLCTLNILNRWVCNGRGRVFKQWGPSAMQKTRNSAGILLFGWVLAVGTACGAGPLLVCVVRCGVGMRLGGE